MRYDVYLENDNGEVIKVLNHDITLDNGEWTFTKTLDEWIDLAVNDENEIIGKSKGVAYIG